MKPPINFDAYSAEQLALRVENVGVKKANMALVPLIMLGLLAGAFIGLGGMFFVLVKSDPSLSFAMSQVLGGLVFCLGLILVVVAGAELFTGNNLIVMAWVDNKISLTQLLRNWLIVCVANFFGALFIAVLIYLSGHSQLNDGLVGQQYLHIVQGKNELSASHLFFRAIVCNVLVCLAVWMTIAGHSITDKILAVLFPISAFVAAGFEHSVANMYFYPMAMLVERELLTAGATQLLTLGDYLRNLIIVIGGNVVGGAVFVSMVYYLIYSDGK